MRVFKRKSNRVLYGIVLVFTPCFILTCAQRRHSTPQCEVDFSSPRKTIETYYEHHVQEDPYNRAIVSSCFYPPGYMGSLRKFWLEYEIIEQKKTDRAGDTVAKSGIVIDADDIEIIVEVKENAPAKGNLKTQYYYLLHEFLGAWKIVSHSHIADENYPPLDF